MGNVRQSGGRSRPWPAIACATVILGLAAGPARADVESVTVDSSRDFEAVEGYRYLEVTVEGSIDREDGSVGSYAVPMVIWYPTDGGTRTGVIDWVNTTLFYEFGFPQDEALATIDTHDAVGQYLHEHGYTFASVQWDKAVTDLFGPSAPDDGEPHNHLVFGTIERGTDAWAILRDAADVLRHPDVFAGAEAPPATDVVLSSGFSQTGMLLNNYLGRGENSKDGELAYDGHMISYAGFACWPRHNGGPDYGEGPVPCQQGAVADGAKAISLNSQTEAEFLWAALARFQADHPDRRHYELAGVSHLPEPMFPGLFETQNPADPRPAFRAAFDNLAQWVSEGVAAPPSRFLQGPVDDSGYLDTALDEDGNALGGLRLPHMARVVDGQPAGAPLGTYYALHPTADFLFELIAGFFEPFSDEELAERYPDRGAYVQRVARAAETLFENRYIPEEDKDAIVGEAAESDLGF